MLLSRRVLFVLFLIVFDFILFCSYLHWLWYLT